ncbi:hypothetical protein MRB53_026663 [Persea americana]|uniref:Uncharacterized protein n=1 Tax=Persea americana TaxID=3435 RepID=A0ACC2LIN4_PERAE|nr:hypothetical protein MRB53_026663 [Persea americana]
MRKGNMTMDDYLQHAKQYADSLAASGQPMAESDIQQVILNRLDTAYDAIVTSPTTTLAYTPMEDFQAHLLAFESRIQSQNLVDQVTPVANIATKSSQGQGRGNSSNRGRNSNNRGRGHSNPRSGPRPHTGPCQICGHKNHTASSCWYRFDIWGPAPVISNNGFRYYIIFMDAFSRYTWIFPIPK